MRLQSEQKSRPFSNIQDESLRLDTFLQLQFLRAAHYPPADCCFCTRRDLTLIVARLLFTLGSSDSLAQSLGVTQRQEQSSWSNLGLSTSLTGTALVAVGQKQTRDLLSHDQKKNIYIKITLLNHTIRCSGTLRCEFLLSQHIVQYTYFPL